MYAATVESAGSVLMLVCTETAPLVKRRALWGKEVDEGSALSVGVLEE